MTDHRRPARRSARRFELDLHRLEHPEAQVPDQFARDVLAKKRCLHTARRLFGRYPVGWRIVQRLTFHLLAVTPDKKEAARLLGDALVSSIRQALEFSEHRADEGLEAEWKAFYTALLTPMNGVIPAERLLTLTAVRDPWMTEADPPVEDEAIHQITAGKPHEWSD